MLKNVRETEREIAQYLSSSREDKAKIKAEQLIMYQRLETVYDLLESVCDLLSTRVQYLDQSMKVPTDLVPQLASLFYAEYRCELPEVADVRKQISRKFRVPEEIPESAVIDKFVSLLAVDPPSVEEISGCLADVADRMQIPVVTGGGSAPSGGGGGKGGGDLPSEFNGLVLPKVPKGITSPAPTPPPAVFHAADSPAPPPLLPPTDDPLADRLNRLKK